ncbi:phosphopentomutase [Helcococcus kunzii]|uniref:phosphopentomutase n=1 Tax=Helcococcus kunzii TaxID=40091 RepID=UPI001BB068DE|nr:phosphopentomutase [Helcococcus kunzii]MCT1796998.1 phosphopentomutase [Helcococcus kunzii]MCT1988445.1 phosphopentomutase [Helcococcus kunzii]
MMNKGRFIIIVLDSFGVGEMDDVPQVRPADIGSNTCLHLLEYDRKKQWNNLIKLGLINSLGLDVDGFKKSDTAIFGKSKLVHFGADSYFGHQEIMGTKPKKPEFQKLSEFIDELEQDLLNKGFEVQRVKKNGLELLKVNNMICIGDNMETDLGQAINVVGALDYCGFSMIEEVGHIVRKHVRVPRVIAFGGSNVTIERIEENIITKDGFIGVDAPKSGVYDKNYHVTHIGYGVDVNEQVPIAVANKGVENHLYGKAENIIYAPNGTRFPCVDTNDTFDGLIKDLKIYNKGLFVVNIQETDLSGHAMDAERYIDVLNIADRRIGDLMNLLNEEDVLIIMADHGNDPTIGHTRHTRENVPILVYRKNNNKLIDIGYRETMADVGQTAADYFGTEIKNGKSFLNEII